MSSWGEVLLGLAPAPERPADAEGRRRGFFARLRENLGRSSRARSRRVSTSWPSIPTTRASWERLRGSSDRGRRGRAGHGRGSSRALEAETAAAGRPAHARSCATPSSASWRSDSRFRSSAAPSTCAPSLRDPRRASTARAKERRRSANRLPAAGGGRERRRSERRRSARPPPGGFETPGPERAHEPTSSARRAARIRPRSRSTRSARGISRAAAHRHRRHRGSPAHAGSPDGGAQEGAGVIGRRLPGAPHETLLTIDATTGQNGLQQARLFTQAAEVTGLVLTKLDGTAKGGIAIAIAHELGHPDQAHRHGGGARGSAPVRRRGVRPRALHGVSPRRCPQRAANVRRVSFSCQSGGVTRFPPAPVSTSFAAPGRASSFASTPGGAAAHERSRLKHSVKRQ